MRLGFVVIVKLILRSIFTSISVVFPSHHLGDFTSVILRVSLTPVFLVVLIVTAVGTHSVHFTQCLFFIK